MSARSAYRTPAAKARQADAGGVFRSQQAHPIGATILDQDKFMEIAREVAYSHHEALGWLRLPGRPEVTRTVAADAHRLRRRRFDAR